MTFLLDTNTCIRYLNGRSPNVVARVRATAPSDIVVCSIVKAELFAGAAKSQQRNVCLAGSHWLYYQASQHGYL
jgi:tRNA(fMet)-specific endonuclease VapC